MRGFVLRAKIELDRAFSVSAMMRQREKSSGTRRVGPAAALCLSGWVVVHIRRLNLVSPLVSGLSLEPSDPFRDVRLEMYGDEALKLVLESRRSVQTDTLLKYSDPLIRSICLETRHLGDSIAHTTNNTEPERLRQDPSLVCNLTVQHLSARRNKRCLMAYHMQRMEMLKEMFWASGGSLAHMLNTRGPGGQDGQQGNEINGSSGTSDGMDSINSTDIRSRLSPQEVDFLRTYSTLILDLKSPFLDIPLDLASGISNPPPPAGELFIDVKVVRELGEGGMLWMEDAKGMVEFRLGGRYMCRRSDVERLIVQGYLVEV